MRLIRRALWYWPPYRRRKVKLIDSIMRRTLLPLWITEVYTEQPLMRWVRKR